MRSLVLCLALLFVLGRARCSILDYEYLGMAVQREGMHVWGSSPVVAPDGKIHLFVAQWPIDTQPNFNGWYKDCEIAQYVGDSPEGPFEFVRVAVPDQDGTFNSPHNPTIQHIDGTYVLCFIVNEHDKLKTQRIIMYVADDLNGDWRPAAGAEADGTILRKSTKPTDWNHTAQLGVSNPSLIKHRGKYLLYDKSVVKKNPQAKRGSYTYGVAVSDKLEGPYTHHPKQVTQVGMPLEDAYAFTMDDSVYLISRDFGSKKGSHGGGLLWKSDDGLFFASENVTRSFEHLSHYTGKKALRGAKIFRGDLSGRLERPQILSIDGQPTYLYLATGINTTPGCGSCSHVFRIIKREAGRPEAEMSTGPGHQAEDAIFEGAKVSASGEGFHGRGHLNFGQKKGAYVEWQLENPGKPGTAELTIRYSGKKANHAGRGIKLTANGKTIQERLLLPNTQNWGSDWKTHTVRVPVVQGANSIRLTTIENGGMYLDEISIQWPKP